VGEMLELMELGGMEKRRPAGLVGGNGSEWPWQGL